MITKEMQDALNRQIVNELFSSNAYLSIASWFDGQGLKILSAFFFKQSEEERGHAMRILNYLLEVGGEVVIGSILKAPPTFRSAEHAVETSYEQEKSVTAQINTLMSLAQKQNDYATASFLKWFVDEQVEEESSIHELLLLVRRAGENNLLLVEDRLMRSGAGAVAKKDDDD